MKKEKGEGSAEGSTRTRKTKRRRKIVEEEEEAGIQEEWEEQDKE